jgi:pimeloyl-ACP methyl ester carboxylesterase
MPEIQQLLLSLPQGVEKTRLALAAHSLAALETTKPALANEVVLCLPGFTGSKEDYVAILPVLSEAGYQVISIDHRGQYESKYPETQNSFTLPALAGDVVAIAKQLNKKVHLIGHSMGGLVAAQSVLQNPELFSSLTMLCSGPGAIPLERQKNIEAIRRGFPGTSLSDAWKIIEAEERSANPDRFSEPVWEFRKNRWLASNPQALHETAALLQNTPDFSQELALVLKQNNIGAMVLTAENDDVWPLAEQQRLAETIDGKYVVLADAGHSPARETPAETATALIEFYSQLAESKK